MCVVGVKARYHGGRRRDGAEGLYVSIMCHCVIILD
jgi:hypothetical protein